MRHAYLPILRALAALAIAIASPGVDLAHGLAHDHDHHNGRTQPFSHHVDVAIHAADHSPDHAHQSVSEALRIRADLSLFIPVAVSPVVTDIPAASAGLPLPVSDPKVFGDRSTGPPPRLRAPPAE